MNHFTFALKYQLSPAGANHDDALVGIGLSGRIGLEFVRPASPAREAMESALATCAMRAPRDPASIVRSAGRSAKKSAKRV